MFEIYQHIYIYIPLPRNLIKKSKQLGTYGRNGDDSDDRCKIVSVHEGVRAHMLLPL